MSSEKKYYFLKLNPPRASFTTDMTEEELAIMRQHIAYWTPHVNEGTMLVYGPVFDPKGGYGVGILCVNSEEQLNKLIAGDPANGLNTYEAHPMRAVSKHL